MRKNGESIVKIHKRLGIAKSTASLWLRNINLTNEQKSNLEVSKLIALEKARKRAAVVNRMAKIKRLEKISLEAKSFVSNIDFSVEIFEIFLVGLYLGEGFKNGARTGFCNSNPKTMKGFVQLLRKVYNIDEAKLRCGIYGRYDQNPEALVSFWSKKLNIPKRRFHKTQLDKRTMGRKTKEGYMGVCAVYYFDASIERRLMAISGEILGLVAQSVRAFA